MKRSWIGPAIAGVAAMLAVGTAPARADTEITLWSHWASEKVKRDFVEDAITRFEAANPGVRIKATWYEKSALFSALKTAIRAGKAPDIFYAEPDQTEYIENSLLLPLMQLDWSNVEPWAKASWTVQGKPYGLPLEASTVELYYNKDKLREIGVELPASNQLDAGAFLDLVRKARARNLTPMALGVGDRPFPGAYLSQEALLKRLGIDDYDKLLKGGIPWSDPRVVETLAWVRTLVDAALLPPSFTSLKLGEAHSFFHTNPGALTFLNGSWYTSRAFNPPDKGGQPVGFPLGIMKFPTPPNAVCPECRTLAVSGSYVVNAATKHPEMAVSFLNSLATPGAGNRWLEQVLVQTGIKSDPSSISGPYQDYFKMLLKVNQDAKYYFWMPTQILQGKRREVFTQIINNALPAATISVADAVKQLDAAR